MEKRKKATEKQISYANAIAEYLRIDVRFSIGDSFYDVTKFIRENEENYKNKNKRLASIKQVDYANAISDICDLGFHFNETSTYEQVSNFILKHKKEYIQKIWRREILENEKVYPGNDLTKESLIFICDNLYDKHGVYAFIGDNNEILYVGKSTDLSQRITSSYAERRSQAHIKRILYYVEDNMSDVSILEICLICENKPRLNTESKFDDFPTRYSSGIDILRDFDEIPFLNKGEDFA